MKLDMQKNTNSLYYILGVVNFVRQRAHQAIRGSLGRSIVESLDRPIAWSREEGRRKKKEEEGRRRKEKEGEGRKRKKKEREGR